MVHANSSATRTLIILSLVASLFASCKDDAPPTAVEGQSGTWTRKANMLSGMAYFGACVVNGRIYAIGGDGFTTATQEYDPATNSWTQGVPMPSGRIYHSACAVNGKVYILGGTTNSADPFVGRIAAVHMYDPATGNWTHVSEIPTPNALAAACVFDGKIYVMGDFSGRSTVQQYDPATNTWTPKRPMPTGRGALSASAVGARIYAIGGTVGAPDYVGLSTVEVYYPATDSWATRNPMPTPRWGLTTSVVDGKIYAIGGENNLDEPVPGPSTVEVYDPLTGFWSTAPDMPTKRRAHRSCVVDGKIYVMGGTIGTGWPPFTRVEIFDPAGSPTAIENIGFPQSQLTSIQFATITPAPARALNSLCLTLGMSRSRSTTYWEKKLPL